jgi:hypothetical protein
MLSVTHPERQGKERVGMTAALAATLAWVPTIADIRRLASGDASSPGWAIAAVQLVADLHASQPGLPEEAHRALCEAALPVAAILLSRDIDPDDRALVSDFSASALLARFVRLGNRQDLDEALNIWRAEVLRTDSSWGCEARVNFAAALLVSVEHTGTEEHLAEAQEVLGSALGLAATVEQRAVISGALGNVHLDRYDIHHDPGDLGMAIHAFQGAASRAAANCRLSWRDVRGSGYVSAAA